MKRQGTGVIIMLTLLIVGPGAGAQRFQGGLTAGGNVSQVAGDTLSGYHKFGFQAGGFVALELSRHFTLQMEFDFIQKGSRDNTDVANGDYSSMLMRFNYFEVPLMVQYTFLKNFQVEAGPAMDVTISDYEETDGLEADNTVDLKPVTLCGILGASWIFWNDKMKLNFRWNTSILSIRQTPEKIPEAYRYRFWQWGQFNDVLALSLFYRFK